MLSVRTSVIQNIIFDWSGTLVDDLPSVCHAVNGILRGAGKAELSQAEFRREFTLPFQGFFNRLLPGLTPAELERSFFTHFLASPHPVTGLPHGREFLELCRARNTRLFVLSTAPARLWAAQAANLQLDSFFERTYLGIWDKRARIHSILRENGLRPLETLFIGDMTHDLESARYGGVYSCGVLTGYNTAEQLASAQPDFLVEHLGELGHLLGSRGWSPQEPPPGAPARNGAHPLSTVGALIHDQQGRVLMIRTHKWSNKWGIPGGKIKLGESSVEALRREILEETALQVEDIQFVMVQDCVNSEEFFKPAHFVLLNYTCRVDGPAEVTLNHEAQEFAWVAPAEALAMDLNQPTRVLLEACAPVPSS